MERQLQELESEIERLVILALGTGQLAKQTGRSDLFGKMLAVSRYLQASLNKLREPSLPPAPPPV